MIIVAKRKHSQTDRYAVGQKCNGLAFGILATGSFTETLLAHC
jgi:hypothetical protein